MKVISTPVDRAPSEISREKANMGCNKCPYCGETRSLFDDAFKGADRLRGIAAGIERTELAPGKFFAVGEDGKFHFHIPEKTYHVTEYICYECGSRWESDPWYY